MDLIDPENRETINIKDTSYPLSNIVDGIVGEESLKNSRVSLEIPKEAVPEKFIGEEVFVRVYMTTGLQRDNWTEIPELYLRFKLNE